MATTARPTVELWMRTLPTGEGEEHDELVARLRALERCGRIDGVECRTWPHEVAVDDPRTPRESTVVNRVTSFRRWAATRGVDLPAFERTTTAGVGRMGPAYEALTLPPTALAVYQDGVLVWVAPCVDDEHEYTPLDWIEAAERGRPRTVPTDALLTSP